MTYKKRFTRTVHNTVLSQKMECIGFKESVMKWFQSYLSNSKIFVTLENVFSDAGKINCGVPQELILGPLLCISYGDYSLKQHNTVEYLGCYLDSNLNGESMARRVLKKINPKLNFL